MKQPQNSKSKQRAAKTPSQRTLAIGCLDAACEKVSRMRGSEQEIGAHLHDLVELDDVALALAVVLDGVDEALERLEARVPLAQLCREREQLERRVRLPAHA
eukprot:3562379-Rhodomonas_salina.1